MRLAARRSPSPNGGGFSAAPARLVCRAAAVPLENPTASPHPYKSELMETPSSPTTAQGEITGAAPLYAKPEPLNPELHGKLGLKNSPKPFSFARSQHFVPILAPEMPAAGCSYPIIFAGAEYSPIAVMGLNPGENVFFNDADEIRPDVYLPAYMRRYPFTAAKDESGQRMVICIDREASLISDQYDVAFFDGKELTQYTKDCIQFCENFEADRQRSEQFVARLRELDLFEHREVAYTPPAQPGAEAPKPQIVAGFFAVTEEKLNALSPEVLVEFRDKGYLPAIYAHMTSQMHWDKLIASTLAKRMAEAEANKGKKPN